MYHQFESPYRPKELTEQRKIASDIKNNTDELTFEKKSDNARAAAYRNTRDLAYTKEIAKLESQSNEDEMLAELEALEKEFIDG